MRSTINYSPSTVHFRRFPALTKIASPAQGVRLLRYDDLVSRGNAENLCRSAASPAGLKAVYGSIVVGWTIVGTGIVRGVPGFACGVSGTVSGGGGIRYASAVGIAGMRVPGTHRFALPRLRNDHQLCLVRPRQCPGQLLCPADGICIGADMCDGILGRRICRDHRKTAASRVVGHPGENVSHPPVHAGDLRLGLEDLYPSARS